MKLILQERNRQLNKAKSEEELVQSQNMRNALFEIFGETRKRKENYTSEGL